MASPTPTRRQQYNSENDYDDDDDEDDEVELYDPHLQQFQRSHHSPDNETAAVRSDAVLRHDVLKILLSTQRSEAQSRSKMLERKTLLTRYCTTMLKWMEFTLTKVSHAAAAATTRRNEKKERTASAPLAIVHVADVGVDNNNGDDQRKTEKNQPEFHGVVRVGSSPSRNRNNQQEQQQHRYSPREHEQPAPQQQQQQQQQQPDNFIAIPHATLHTLRRQWQKRVAVLLQRRSFFTLLQRTMNKWKLFRTSMRGSQEAYRALASSEAAMGVSRSRRRQVILNSVEMQRVRALRALGVRALFKWRLFTSSKQNFAKKVDLLQREAQATALILVEQQLREKQEQERLQNVPPASLESLVSALQSKSLPSQLQGQFSPAPVASAAVVRPAFFRAPTDSALDYSPPRERNAASDVIIAQSCKSLKAKVSRLKSDMARIKSDVRQASSWIATECTQWNLKFLSKFSGNNTNSNNQLHHHYENSSNNLAPNNAAAAAVAAVPPPTWQYERSILQRRAAAYDALLEDHRMLQESLKAAEDDIARLRSIAVLREMHSPLDDVAKNNSNNHNNTHDQLGLISTPRIQMKNDNNNNPNPNYYYNFQHPVSSIGRESRSGSVTKTMTNVGEVRSDSASRRFAAATHRTSTSNIQDRQQQQQRQQSGTVAGVNTTVITTTPIPTTTTTTPRSYYYPSYQQLQQHQEMRSPGGAQVPPEQLGVSCFTL